MAETSITPRIEEAAALYGGASGRRRVYSAIKIDGERACDARARRRT